MGPDEEEKSTHFSSSLSLSLEGHLGGGHEVQVADSGLVHEAGAELSDFAPRPSEPGGSRAACGVYPYALPCQLASERAVFQVCDADQRSLE